mgnify:CR=1 FL=1
MRLSLLIILLFSALSAQTYQEYLRSQEQAFSSFKEERDREFSEFLNKEWKAYKEAQGIKAYEENKPRTLPKAEKKKSIKPREKVLVLHQPAVKKKAKAYKKIIIPSPSQKLKTLYLDFFGVGLEVHYDSSILISLEGGVSKDKIADSWDRLAGSEYEVTVKELKEVSAKLRLNDWAKYLLIREASEGIYKNQNEARLFSWFALLKMGYDARLAYQRNKLLLLLPVEGALYNTIYYTLNKRRYYAIDYYAKGKLGSVMTYAHIYKGASAGISFAVSELPLLAENKIHRRLLFRPDKDNRAVDLYYNENLLRFFQSYPQVAYTNYFSSPESVLLDESLKASFEPLIVGKSQSEALDIILSFVQNAFKYRVDHEQFSREKVMFPSETIFYPYSDCEDRAILFSYMVKTLLGMDVVGVKYSNHMATAVRIEEKIRGEYLLLGEEPYIIADPTYINARLGMSMPQFVGTKSYEIVSTGGEK